MNVVIKSGRWSQEEDEALRCVVAKIGSRSWVEVAQFLRNRTGNQCMQRWCQVLRPGLRKGAWTVEEDNLLREVVYDHLGERIHEKPFPRIKSWKFTEEALSWRTSKQCRERWVLSLNPNINKDAWDFEEDQKLMNLQKLVGNKWTLIKELMNNNRTENSIKLRHKKLKRKRVECVSETSYKNVRVSVEDFIELEKMLDDS
eukprot:augustus_masked-scaffold_3-processed-gene-13.60-mRNA-1 protein AED:0.10 eAED:0.10 QI:0/-1/0/1/-1/1/1/0/200